MITENVIYRVELRKVRMSEIDGDVGLHFSVDTMDSIIIFEGEQSVADLEFRRVSNLLKG